MIVLEDADIDAAANFAVQNSFRNCGQVCVSTERIYVADAIAASGATAVDVSSGVEDAPGVKNPENIRGFIAAAKGA